MKACLSVTPPDELWHGDSCGSCDYALAAAFSQGEICIAFWRASGYLRAEAEPGAADQPTTSPGFAG